MRMPNRSSAYRAIAMLLAASAGASAQTYAIVAAAGGSGLTNFEDVRSKMIASGVVQNVDIINLATTTPTLAELQMYNAVLVWTNTTPANTNLFGDALADYVDGGGGVVVTVFALNSTTTNRWIGGRWQGTYDLIPARSGTTSGLASLGMVHDPSHPIMQGVSSFSGGTSSFRATGNAVAAHGVRIADWSDGRPLIVTSTQYATRVDLNFYPPSSDVSATWWASNTDGGRIMANALVFAGAGAPGCYANCDGSTVEPVLNVDDFTCFINEYAAAQGLPHEQQVTHYANCDGSTIAPALNVDDFTCFINEYAAGCP